MHLDHLTGNGIHFALVCYEVCLYIVRICLLRLIGSHVVVFGI